MLVGDGDRALGCEGHLPGDHLEQADARAVDVRAGICVTTLDVLGGEVGDRPDDHPLGRRGVVGHRAREAEVGDLHPPVVGDEDVLRLDVAVHESGIVRCGQGLEHRVENRQGLLGGEGAVVAQHVAQGATGDVFHGEVGKPGRLALVEDGDDMGVAELRGGPGLPAEARDESWVLGECGAHHLEGYRAIESGVDGLVDGRHATPGDPGHHLVAAVHEGPDEGIGRSCGDLAGRGIHDGLSLGRGDAPSGDARIRRGSPSTWQVCGFLGRMDG